MVPTWLHDESGQKSKHAAIADDVEIKNAEAHDKDAESSSGEGL